MPEFRDGETSLPTVGESPLAHHSLGEFPTTGSQRTGGAWVDVRPQGQSALRQLAESGRVSDPPTWSCAVVRLEACGRLLLREPTALVLRRGPGSGSGRRSRGRLDVPVWLRGGPSPSSLVGTRAATATAVVAPATVLDALAEALAREQQP
jgi:hypothetical protein